VKKDKRDAALEMAGTVYAAIENIETNIVHLNEGRAAESNCQKALELLREAHKLVAEAYMWVR
jgi:hypothetical protein